MCTRSNPNLGFEPEHQITMNELRTASVEFSANPLELSAKITIYKNRLVFG